MHDTGRGVVGVDQPYLYILTSRNYVVKTKGNNNVYIFSRSTVIGQLHVTLHQTA